jgi:hypothetical protein
MTGGIRSEHIVQRLGTTSLGGEDEDDVLIIDSMSTTGIVDFGCTHQHHHLGRFSSGQLRRSCDRPCPFSVVSQTGDDFSDLTNENEFLTGDDFVDGYLGLDSFVADNFTDDVFPLWNNRYEENNMLCSPPVTGSNHQTTGNASVISHADCSSFSDRISFLWGGGGRRMMGTKDVNVEMYY